MLQAERELRVFLPIECLKKYLMEAGDVAIQHFNMKLKFKRCIRVKIQAGKILLIRVPSICF